MEISDKLLEVSIEDAKAEMLIDVAKLMFREVECIYKEYIICAEILDNGAVHITVTNPLFLQCVKDFSLDQFVVFMLEEYKNCMKENVMKAITGAK